MKIRWEETGSNNNYHEENDFPGKFHVDWNLVSRQNYLNS